MKNGAFFVFTAYLEKPKNRRFSHKNPLLLSKTYSMHFLHSSTSTAFPNPLPLCQGKRTDVLVANIKI
jgi:hypothetical protein